MWLTRGCSIDRIYFSACCACSFGWVGLFGWVHCLWVPGNVPAGGKKHSTALCHLLAVGFSPETCSSVSQEDVLFVHIIQTGQMAGEGGGYVERGHRGGALGGVRQEAADGGRRAGKNKVQTLSNQNCMLSKVQPPRSTLMPDDLDCRKEGQEARRLEHSLLFTAPLCADLSTVDCR